MGPDLEKLIHELNLRMRLLQAVQETRNHLQDLTQRELLLMEFIEEKGPLSISLLSATCPEVSDSTISTMVTRLWREKKLVSKQIDPDNQRVTLVSLTSEGGQLLDKIRNLRSQRYNIFFHAIHVTPEEKQVLMDVFERAIEYIDEHFMQQISDANR